MNCMNCGALITDADFCTGCGADVGIYKKIIYRSNECYNDGLSKCHVRDLSGARASLEKSLKYNKRNVPARNLLGLVLYAQGEVVAALAQWIISKNIQSEKNIASQYIESVQSNQTKLNVLNQTIKKFNVALSYCQQGSEDLAIIQLKKILSTNPNLLKAQQLLALLYLKEEDYEKAAQCVDKAMSIDIGNTMSRRLKDEIYKKTDRAAESGRGRGKQTDQIAYQQGNETIIQPASIRDHTGIMTVVNIIIGMGVGLALAWFLVMPARVESAKSDANNDVRKYSEQLEEKNSEINKLQSEIDGYGKKIDDAESKSKSSETKATSYESLIELAEAHIDKGTDVTKILELMDGIDEKSLSDVGKSLYDKIMEDISVQASKTLYQSGNIAYRQRNYDNAIKDLERVVEINERYNEGYALFYLADCYRQKGDTAKAIELYQQFMTNHPGTRRARQAAGFIETMQSEGNSPDDNTE